MRARTRSDMPGFFTHTKQASAMPGEADRRAEDEAEADEPAARVALVQRGLVERRLEEVVDDVRDLRDLQQAADDRQQRERAHRDLHRRLALGDVVLGPGEADVGVLDLAVGGVRVDLGVVQVAFLELERLRHRVAQNARKIIRNV